VRGVAPRCAPLLAAHAERHEVTQMTVRCIVLMVVLLLASAGAASAQASAEQGENVFKKCKACHDVGEGAKNKVGPLLNDVLGRQAGSVEGYPYSGDLKALGAQGFVWDEKNLGKYLENPKSIVGMGKMMFSGLKDEQDRQDVIAYLKKFSK
jgi:cytochrome c